MGTMRPPRLILLALTLLMAGATVLAQEYDPDKLNRGRWRPQDAPKGWRIYERGRYQFQSNADPAKIEQVADHMAAMFKAYSKAFPSRRTPGHGFAVKLFATRAEFVSYGKNPGAGAYYSDSADEMVGYDTGMIGGELESRTTDANPLTEMLRRKHSMDLLGVIAHEGWHQYFHWYCTSKIDFPSWCDEGIGEYFYTAVADGKGKVTLGAPNTYRLETIQNAIKRSEKGGDGYIPLAKLIRYRQRDYYAVAGLAYAEGWSLVHFLMEHPKYRKKRYVERFVRTFVDLHDIDASVDRAFAGLDWDKVEQDWKAWVLALELPEELQTEKALEALLEKRAAEQAEKAGKPAGESDPPPPPAPPAGDG